MLQLPARDEPSAPLPINRQVSASPGRNHSPIKPAGTNTTEQYFGPWNAQPEESPAQARPVFIVEAGRW